MRRAAPALRLIGILMAAAPAPALAVTRVACVGDSITAGIGSTGGNSYPTVLGRMLGAGYQVGNFGDSGSTALKLPRSTSYWITPAFGNSQTFAPEIVVIMLGTNDSKTNNWKAGNNAFEADYRALIAVYAGLPGKPRIYAALPPPALTSNFSIDGKVIATEILPIIRRVAAAAGVGVIDVNGAFNPDPRKYFGTGDGTDIGDGIHPNNAGAAAIAAAVARKLTEAPADAGADVRPPGDAAGAADLALPPPDVAPPRPDATRDVEIPPLLDAGSPTTPDARVAPDRGGSGDAGGATEEPGGAGGEEPPRRAVGKAGCALGGRPAGGALLGLVLLACVTRLPRRRR